MKKVILLLILSITFNYANAILIIPIPSGNMPPNFQKIIDALEKYDGTKSVALVSENKTFNPKFWIMGKYYGDATQEEADSRALASCEASLAKSKAENVAGQPLYDFREKKCELYKFSNVTLSKKISTPRITNLLDTNTNAEKGNNTSERNISVINFEKLIENSNRNKIEPSRIALIVGNNDYKYAPKLSSAVNDARLMSSTLKQLNFDVELLENSTKEKLKIAITEFSKKLSKSNSVGIFFYAGHGIQYKSHNFIISIDSKLNNLESISDESYDIQTLLDQFKEANNGMNFLILDACRDNPFSQEKDAQTGLAAVDGPPGTLVAFATAPGKVATESKENGVFTKNILANIRTPGLPIEEIFKRVRLGVINETGGTQIPWENTSLIRDFYFIPTTKDNGFITQLNDSEEESWQKINKNNIYELITFYKKFKNSVHTNDVLKNVNNIFATLKDPAPPIQLDELPGIVNEAYVGFVYRTLNSVATEYLGLHRNNAIMVSEVVSGSTAEKAGLMVGDVLISLNGYPVETVQDITIINSKAIPGAYIEGVILREGKQITLKGVIERRNILSMIDKIGEMNLLRKNFVRARIQYEYLAKVDYPRGHQFYGIMNLRGLGGEKNLGIAESELLKSAMSTSSSANLALAYLTPNSGLSNDNLAFKLAKYSAEKGDPDGATALALCYFRGVGTEKDPYESFKWSRYSAELGNTSGMFLLGARYEDGSGGNGRNIEAAKTWYRRARDAGSQPAKAALQRLGE
jgi:hypothetical protein